MVEEMFLTAAQAVIVQVEISMVQYGLKNGDCQTVMLQGLLSQLTWAKNLKNIILNLE
ncbi:hypothetical protein KR52_12995 [Synechococcus sp. KORDI-52]|nr:hypothetical protein KR52_12995 [Synechococcus sp. KORDI-52]